MSTGNAENLRTTFDTAAERYDRARPSYNAALFEELRQRCTLGPGSRVLEIGCGTGQASLPLARMGCEITAIELGENLAAIARDKLRTFPGCHVVTGAFESQEIAAGGFDVVLAATSWHWLEPDARTALAAKALRPGGWLATIATEHVADGTGEFFERVQDCYERWDPATPPGLRLAPASAIPPVTDEVDASPFFELPAHIRFEQDIHYSAEAYLDVLLTYSGHIALRDEARTGLLDCIRGLISGEFGGRITKRYLWEMRLARRRREPHFTAAPG